jgi:PAS domain S-box-containing protein
VQPRHIARVALFLALTVVSFIIARVLAERDVRRDSDRRAEVAAVQIHGRIAQAASVVESLRRFMLDARSSGVTSDRFARDTLRWLGPARFPAAAWVERVRGSERAAYERRIGKAIVTADARNGVVRLGSRSSYLPATLVTGFPPMAVPGVDLSGAAGLAAALRRATRRNGVVATAGASLRTGTRGLFLVAPAPNRIGKALRPGYVALFVSAVGLRAAATGVPAVQVRTAGGSAQARDRSEASTKAFTAAGERFTVIVPREPVQGAAAALPWVILAGGLLVAALGGALGLNAARRARAQRELDRIFTMSQDLIAVADFNGRFTRVNPAGEAILGYTEEELLARPYADLVHPADRDSTTTEADAVARGQPTGSFQNRYVRKDGSVRALDWTATPDVENRLVYAVARDVTERRHAEAEVKRLADEQTALRRVATLVAREAPQADVFRAIAEEIMRLLDTKAVRMWRYEGDTHAVVVAGSGPLDAFRVGDRFELGGKNVPSLVFQTGRSARIDDFGSASGAIGTAARTASFRQAVGTPIVVEGRLWGAMVTATYDDDPLPPETDERLGPFTELIATAIAKAEARAEVERLAEEQAALRRVATLVAEAAPPATVLDAVVAEMQALLDADQVALNRFEPGEEILVLAHRGLDVARTPVGARVSTSGESVTATVRHTGKPARIEGYEEAPGPLAELARATGLRSSVSVPIVVQGRLWGVITASWKTEKSQPPDTEERMIRFGELAGTAVANTEARAEIERLASEQGALRRVATLIAEEASLEVVFAKVAEELTALLGGADCSVFRDEGDGTAKLVGLSGAPLAAGSRMPLDETGLIATVIREGQPDRADDPATSARAIAAHGGAPAIRSAVGCPIAVRGRHWGAIVVARREPDPLEADTKARIERFAELVARAVGNAETRAEIERLADEQAALRRVATLVAEGPPPTAVFDAVAAEMAKLLEADQVTLSRYEADEVITVVADRGPNASLLPPGTRLSYEGDNVTALVQRTGRSGRVEHAQPTTGPIADVLHDPGVRVSVGAPIVVEGRLWGVILARWQSEEPAPDDTEQRMARFAELLDTAIANADGRDQLMASRARLLTAGDDARRRVVRDLHDGAQQRLVHTVVALKLAQQSLARVDTKAASFIAEALEHAESSNAELRELAHGMLPAVLTRGGLVAGVNAVVARLDLPVSVDIPPDRFPAEIEASAYFIAAEALTNVLKHSAAASAAVRVRAEDGVLRLEIDDDGIGGADPRGHGLVGLADRVTALGGRIDIASPPGRGTCVTATLPL